MTKKQSSDTEITIIPVEQIGQRIYLIRGVKVMLDADLAALYQVETFNLNKAVTSGVTQIRPVGVTQNPASLRPLGVPAAGQVLLALRC